MDHKKCTKCGEVRALDAFGLNCKASDGRQSHCKVCRTAATRKWRTDNPEKKRAADCKYRLANSEKCRATGRKWRAANREKRREVSHKYRVDNREKCRESARKRHAASPEKHKEADRRWHLAHSGQRRERYRNNLQYRLECRLRHRAYKAVKGNFKAGSAVRDLGCLIPYFKTYLEMQFQPGMTWKNYGNRGWHIDHIRPLASFDLTDRAQFLEAVHYTNLQPMWAEDNRSKGAKMPEAVRALELG